MADTRFKLGTYSKSGGGPFVGLVIGEKIYTLARVAAAYDGRRPTTTASIQAMLEGWDANFDALYEIAEFVASDGRDDADWGGVAARGKIKELQKALVEERMRRPGITELVDAAAKKQRQQWDKINRKIATARKPMPWGTTGFRMMTSTRHRPSITSHVLSSGLSK